MVDPERFHLTVENVVYHPMAVGYYLNGLELILVDYLICKYQSEVVSWLWVCHVGA